MREIDLAEYPVTDSVSWLLLAAALAVALIRLWEALRLGLSPIIASAATISVVIGLLVSKGLRRKSSILVEDRTLKVTTFLFGKQIHQRHKDLLDAAWVRARVIGHHQTQIAVEVGTVGFRTTELVRVANKNGKGIPQAEMLCARVAANLNIPSKGFKGLA